VLAAAHGWDNLRIAADLHVIIDTVREWPGPVRCPPRRISEVTRATWLGITGALTRSSMSPVDFYAVRQRRGGPWDWSRDLRGQVGFEDHARFVDGLVDSGFIVLGGPLQGEREVLIVVNAPNEDVVRKQFADDPWIQSGMLALTTVERWTILLDGLRKGLPDLA